MSLTVCVRAFAIEQNWLACASFGFSHDDDDGGHDYNDGDDNDNDHDDDGFFSGVGSTENTRQSMTHGLARLRQVPPTTSSALTTTITFRRFSSAAVERRRVRCNCFFLPNDTRAKKKTDQAICIWWKRFGHDVRA